jgi:predicted oxidoreductase
MNQKKIKFSPLIIGVMNWGVWGKNLTQKEMGSLMSQCIELGLTSFDHAAIYGGYTTEEAFGSAFVKSGFDRAEVQLISKCGIQYPSDNSPHFIKHYDYSSKEIVRSAEQSLKNLKTDYLDVLLFHRPSPIMQLDEVLEALTRLFESGKILSFGVSNFDVSKVDLMRKICPVSFNQIEFSLTHNDALTNGLLDYMQTHDIQPMAWKPLGNVFKNLDNSDHFSNVLVELSNKYSCTTDALLLAWILMQPAKIIPVIGTTSIQRIKNQMVSSNLNLTLEDWFYLYTASLGHKVP